MRATGMGDGTRGPRRRRLAWLAVLASFLIVAAACGDTAETTTTTTGAPPETTTTTSGGDTTTTAPPATTTTTAPPPPTTAPPGSIIEGGVLRIGLLSAPVFLDPTLSGDSNDRTVFRAICEPLYTLDREQHVQLALATAMPEVSEDGLTWTIPLREDAMFNDGTEFNAEAVKISLDRHLTHAESQRAGEIGSIASVEVVDDHTIQLNLNQPDAILVFELGKRAGMIMSPAKLDELGDDFQTDPTCVGPFRFVSREGDEVVVEKSDLYYGAADVHLDGVEFIAITDRAARLANLQSGDIHVAQLDPQIADDVVNDPDLVLDRAASDALMAMRVNANAADGRDNPPAPPDSPTAILEVREAFSLGLDRQVLADVIVGGFAVAACGHAGPLNPVDLGCEVQPADPDGARALLEQAAADNGFELPVPIEILAAEGRGQDVVAEAIQAMLAPVGFEITITIIDQGAVLDRGFAGDYEMIISPWTGRVDPGATYNTFFRCGGPINLTGFCDETMGALLVEARAETDLAARQALYQQIHEIVVAGYHYIPMYHPEQLLGIRPEVTGVFTYPDVEIEVQSAAFVNP